MNTYNMTKDYYNYANNNYNQPLYDQNIQDKQIYDPYNGFIRGNMFPELYNSYKLNKPLEITPMNEQAELLTYVDALTFAMIDLNIVMQQIVHHMALHIELINILQVLNPYFLYL